MEPTAIESIAATENIATRDWRLSASRYIPLAVFLLTLVWYAGFVLRFQTHGAIGDDPATYVQMALDMSRRGTVTHAFPLFNNFYDKGLSWDAFISPGYHVVRETGAMAPNFGWGFPGLLALAYRAAGDGALYWLTPVLGGLSLVATFALASELWRALSPTRRYWIGALAALLLATTPKQIQLALVPMSDVPTQLFCVLAVWCGVVMMRPLGVSCDSGDELHRKNRRPRRSAVLAAICGLCFGIACLMRQSAFVLIAPLAIVAWRWGESGRERNILILAALAVFGLVIAPDFFYRTQLLYSPFAPWSPESAQLALLDTPVRIYQMISALNSVTGIGPILLVAFAGALAFGGRENRFALDMLSVWFIAFLLFHAPLRLTGVFENSLRYLVPAYPAIALLIGCGMVLWFDAGVTAIRELRAGSGGSRRRQLVAVLGLAASVALLLVSLRAVVSPERFVARAYGWMSETARKDMEALREQLPANAVIGTSDQMAGATLLYAGRDVFRPASFLEAEREFPLFLEAMRREGRGVYLLGDWECSPIAGASEKLPDWLGGLGAGDWRLETGDWRISAVDTTAIRDLPYECKQRVREIK